MPDRISFGELNRITYTRDAWLHRTDIARATGRDPRLVPDVDGRLVEDVVAEWAQRHRRPFELSLRGPAGGRFVAGAGGPSIELDVVDFLWVLSGRSDPPTATPGGELLVERVLF